MGDRFPFGLPSGWFVIAASAELRPGQLITRRYFEREIVAFRTESGALSVVDAHCPHMGAHLGRVGKVDGDVMRCGFHGFCYDAAGKCVSTSYDSPPPERARLTHWHFRERNGLILVWFHPDGIAPTWEVPPLEQQGWSTIRWRRFAIATHPQETTENSVDFGHFTELHGFVDGSVIEPLQTDGHLLTSTYGAMRPYGIPGKTLVKVPVQYLVTVAGLGYSQVEIVLPWLRWNIRAFVLPVPVDDEHIDLMLGISVETKLGPLLPLMNRIALHILCKEVGQDLDVWEHKAFVERPALAKGDGPVAQYRRWAQQFYA